MFAAVAFRGGNGVGTGWEHAHMGTPGLGPFFRTKHRKKMKNIFLTCDHVQVKKQNGLASPPPSSRLLSLRGGDAAEARALEPSLRDALTRCPLCRAGSSISRRSQLAALMRDEFPDAVQRHERLRASLASCALHPSSSGFGV